MDIVQEMSNISVDMHGWLPAGKNAWIQVKELDLAYGLFPLHMIILKVWKRNRLKKFLELVI